MSSRPVYRYRCAGAFEGRIQGTVPRGWSDAGVEKCGSGARGGDATRSKGAPSRSDAIVRFVILRDANVLSLRGWEKRDEVRVADLASVKSALAAQGEVGCAAADPYCSLEVPTAWMGGRSENIYFIANTPAVK